MLENIEFLSPVELKDLHDDHGYTEGQLGAHIAIHEKYLPDLEKADIAIIGITENRGEGTIRQFTDAVNIIRKHLYQLHYWHTDIGIADLGNIKVGAKLTDSYAAIKSEMEELLRQGKKVLLLGGSHDNTLAQYSAYRDRKEQVEFTCIDAAIDLSQEMIAPSKSFLLPLLTAEPNYIKHYNHIAFQSYYVHPRVLETIDKLRFDCYKVGTVQSEIEEMEPVFRSSNMVSMDINCIKYSDAPANIHSPNGLSGVEACLLARFAGMSSSLSSFGIYGYHPEDDVHEMTAKQIAQIIWYFIDGVHKQKFESSFEEKQNFNEFHTMFNEIGTLFLQSKRTGRWWMQMPDGEMIPCSHNDYLMACSNRIPERWLRVQERM